MVTRHCAASLHHMACYSQTKAIHPIVVRQLGMHIISPISMYIVEYVLDKPDYL